MSDAFERGMQVRRRVLGDAHVDRAEADKSELDAPFQTLITEAAWGGVWASDALSLRERSMLTLALLAALGHWDEFAMHVRATAATGATRADVREALMHVAVYAGVPAANRGMGVARRTFREMDEAAARADGAAHEAGEPVAAAPVPRVADGAGR